MKPASFLPGLMVLMAAVTAAAQAPAAPPSAPLVLSPFTVAPLQAAVNTVPTTDGRTHVSFATQVTNVQPKPIQITSFAIVDAATGRPAAGQDGMTDMAGQSISGQVRLFAPPEGGPAITRTLPGGASGILFLDIAFDRQTRIPRTLAFAVGVANPPGGAETQVVTTAIPVRPEPPIVLRPPLVGPGWWAGNGCCSLIIPHRAATLPLNGRIRAGEQFAIDFVQVRPEGSCCTGPVAELTSWPFFGAPVVAAAAGRVVAVENGLPDQEPVGSLKDVSVATAGGNSVIIDMGGGRYAAYGHFRKGSVAAGIVVGATVRAGQLLGHVGNSGNSTAPHLHFQVMDRPSFLDAIGLPFVFDRQTIEAVVTGPADAADEAYEKGTPLTLDRHTAGARMGEMPMGGQVLTFGPAP